MNTPISTSATTAETIEQMIANIDSLGQSLNVSLSASDPRFRTFQDELLRATADEAIRTINQAKTVLATLQSLQESDTETVNMIDVSDEEVTSVSPDTSREVISSADNATENVSTSAMSLPDDREFERIPVRENRSSESYFNQANLQSPAVASFIAQQENTSVNEGMIQNSHLETGQTTLSSASEATTSYSQPDSTSTSIPTGTTLSSAETTTLSSGENSSNANKYVGYTDTSSGSKTAEYASYTPGVTMSKTNLQELASIQDKMTYGPEIFDEIWFEDGEDEYYDEYYDDYYDNYGYEGYGFVDGYEGEPMVLVGNPTDQTMLDVSQVTYERPQDMTVSKEEFDAIFEEIMWRAAIDDPVAQDKWYQTLTLIAQHESNMNPAAANGWDSNAVGATQSDGYPSKSSRGMFQTIPGTFAANHMGGTSTSIYDPAASMGAAVNYLMSRYGCDRYGNGLDAFYSARVPVYHGY